MRDSETSRRRFILSGGAAASALLAGCTGGAGSGGSNGSNGTNSSTATAAGGNGSETQTEENTAESGSYSVSMAPVGTVEFESVPKKWVANNGSWADMGVSLGVEPPQAVWMTDRYHTRYYEEIPGVSVDTSDMVDLYSDGVSKELFYQLDSDVHVIDPNFLMNRFKGWKQADVDEIAQKVAPFFGNSIFSRGYSWHESYRYYTLYEAFEKMSQLFQRPKRYEAFAALHDDFLNTVRSNLPPKSERPAVAVFWATGDEPESFLPYLISAGTSFKQWRDLKVTDALANSDVKDFHSARGEIGFETLLEIDPDVLLLRGHEGKTAEEFQNTVVAFMKNHPIASDLTAVKQGKVFQGGPLYQGPTTNLVLTERGANQLYPDAFEGVTLFDRQRVADIINGNL